MGYKKMSKEKIKTRTFFVRVREADGKRLEEVTEKAGITFSEYIRYAITEKLNREKK